ncbi:hypothetical protein NC651_035729 [Populus alba x Populus x berolinensis]|nr:hypothetical protein NC651_035729 [Populus alba x Populus x berolinensis]
MGKMLKLPSTFLFSGNGGGVLHGSTCEAIVCTLVAARDETLRMIGAENSATVGTTACGAVDPVMDLGKIARKYNLWFHIDAAYAEYLRNNASESNDVVDYKDWQIALSRRFRALKLWIVIRRHGLTNLMYHIRSDVNLANRFESLVAKDSRFEVVHNDECQGLELNRTLLAAVNESGRAFMTHAVVGGLFIIRCAIGSTLTEERHPFSEGIMSTFSKWHVKKWNKKIFRNIWQ